MLKFWRKKEFSFKCSCCGETHSGSPSLHQVRPVFYLNVPENERKDRTFISDDVVIVFENQKRKMNNALIAIRVVIEIPILGVNEPMLLGVWAEVSEPIFMKYVDSFEGDQSHYLEKGELTITQPYYIDTSVGDECVRLACNIVGQTKGQRPKLILDESAHELYFDQRDGIKWSKAIMIYQRWIHGV